MTPTRPTPHVLEDLVAWCELARDTFASTATVDDSRGTRQLKRHLSRLHARHLAQLLQLAGRSRADARRSPRHWEDLLAAMRTPDDDVVVGACGLVERSLIAAYTRAEENPALDPAGRRVLHRQRLELKCSYSYYLRRLSRWRQKALRPTEREEPLVGALTPALA